MFDAISAEVQYRHQQVGRDWQKGRPVFRRLLRSIRRPVVRPARGAKTAIGRVAGA